MRPLFPKNDSSLAHAASNAIASEDKAVICDKSHWTFSLLCNNDLHFMKYSRISFVLSMNEKFLGTSSST